MDCWKFKFFFASPQYPIHHSQLLENINLSGIERILSACLLRGRTLFQTFLKKGSLLPCQFNKKILWEWYINGVTWRSDRTIIRTINQKLIRSLIGCKTGSDMLKIAGLSYPSVILHPYPKDLFRILVGFTLKKAFLFIYAQKISFDLNQCHSQKQVKLSQNQIWRDPWLSRWLSEIRTFGDTIKYSFVEICQCFEKKKLLSLSSGQNSEAWGVRSTLFRNVGTKLDTFAVDVSHKN